MPWGGARACSVRGRRLALGAAVLTLAAAAAGCGSTVSVHHFREADVRKFTVRCERALRPGYGRETAVALCRCVLHNMRQEVPPADFAAFTEALRTNGGFEPTDAVTADLRACGV